MLAADCGSSDGTLSVLERFASGSPVRIRPVHVPGGSMAAARNQAAAESDGRLLLFLADDELASPRLVENHAETQTRKGARDVLIGAVNRHPQLPPEAVTRLFLRDAPEARERLEPVPFMDWPDSNFSIPRPVFDRFAGFTQDADFLTLEHLELAHRLCAQGVKGAALPDTRSYVWQPALLEVERTRAYNAGFSLYHLLRITKSKSISQRYRLRRSALERFAASFIVPSYIRACQRQEKENRLFVGTLYRRILSHDRSCGFEDACNGRPRRPPASNGPPSGIATAAPG